MKNVYISSSQNQVDDFLAFNLKRELEEYDYKIINTEQVNFNQTISPEYYINKCDIFIAIVKYAEPVLFFEIGYASALSKKIIIISNNEDEIPYFLKNYSFIKADTYHTSIGHQLTQILGNLAFEHNHDMTYPNNLKEFIHSYRVNPQIIERLTEREFEQIVFNHFRYSTNYQPEEPTSSKDYGYDMILNNYNGHHRTLVEIKKYNPNSKVSINVVQQLIGAMSLYNADYGILLTTSTFTLSARDFASVLPYKIELWDLKYLENELR